MQKGYFITIEGIEGAGKSTVIKFIEKLLREKNIDLVLTREFGGTEIAEKIRKILLDHHQEKMCPNTEILLAFAARAQHLENLIIPSLNSGKWVICDRFTDTSYAYQGAGRGIDIKKIATLETFVQGKLRPDYTFLLDLDVHIGFARVKKFRELDRIEAENIEFFQRIRSCYLERAKNEPERFIIIDAAKPLAQVTEQITAGMQKIFNQ